MRGTVHAAVADIGDGRRGAADLPAGEKSLRYCQELQDGDTSLILRKEVTAKQNGADN